MAGNMPRVILAVEDYEASREVLAIYLRHLGYEVLEAATCAEALKLVHANPDLVLLDVELPDGSGWTVAELIHGRHPDGKVPIVVISSVDMPGTVPVAVAAYLQKPADLGALAGLVHKLIGPPDATADATITVKL